MQLDKFPDFLPLWGLLLATVVVALLAVEGGYWLGRYQSRRFPDKEAPLATMVAASLGLTAFLLAFTFGVATSHFDDRREVFLNEVNAIGTAYLRAQFLPEPEHTETRELLRQYVDVRMKAVRSGNIQQVQQAIVLSETFHARLWSQAVTAGKKNPSPVVFGLFVQSLNEMIDLHTKRVVAGLRTRIPAVIWLVLYATTVLGMVHIGHYVGLTDPHRSLAIPAFALIFSVVLLLIADLDRPGEGLIKVDQAAMYDLRRTMTP
jgi:hypothetical protein